MKLMRAGSRPSQKGPDEYFTGAVRIDTLNAPFAAKSPQKKFRRLARVYRTDFKNTFLVKF